MFAGKLFRLSSDAVDSFNVLVDLMQKAKELGSEKGKEYFSQNCGF